MQGICTADEALRCHEMLLDAQLECASSPTERSDVLTKALDYAKSQEDFYNQKAIAGFVSKLATLQAKAYRLKIEIMLATETGK